MTKTHTVTFSYNPEKLVLFNGTSQAQSQAERLVEQLGLEDNSLLNTEGELRWLESSAELSDILRHWRQLYKALDRKKRMLKRGEKVIRASAGASSSMSAGTSTGTEEEDNDEDKVDYTSSCSTGSDSTRTSSTNGGDTTTTTTAGIASSTHKRTKHSNVSSDEGDSLYRRKRQRI